jgi:cytochrome c peroxidase
VSPEDAQRRFAANPNDPLFVHDGSDDFKGNGASRMLRDATILVEIPLPPNVSLADDPGARTVVLRRGIPTTLNTPALDPVLMSDGRQPSLQAQAMGAIHDHAQAAGGRPAKSSSGWWHSRSPTRSSALPSCSHSREPAQRRCCQTA